jgi:hypothetical protein
MRVTTHLVQILGSAGNARDVRKGANGFALIGKEGLRNDDLAVELTHVSKVPAKQFRHRLATRSICGEQGDQ